MSKKLEVKNLWRNCHYFSLARDVSHIDEKTIQLERHKHHESKRQNNANNIVKKSKESKLTLRPNKQVSQEIHRNKESDNRITNKVISNDIKKYHLIVIYSGKIPSNLRKGSITISFRSGQKQKIDVWIDDSKRTLYVDGKAYSENLLDILRLRFT